MDDQFVEKSDAMYAHVCEHIVKFRPNNTIYLRKEEIETPENNFRGNEINLKRIDANFSFLC